MGTGRSAPSGSEARSAAPGGRRALSLRVFSCRGLADAATGVAATGLLAAGVLSLGHLLNLPVPCGGGAGCAAVAAHPASRLAGVPLAYLGMGFWGLLFLWLCCGRPERPPGRTISLLASAGGGASIGLLFYSYREIGSVCGWCLLSGACMVLLGALLWLMRRRHAPGRVNNAAFPWILLSLVAAGWGVSAGFMERSARQPLVDEGRLAAVGAGELVAEGAQLGPEDAVVTLVVFADIWCPACRMIHTDLLKYQHRHPQLVRLVFRHLPLAELPGHGSSRAAAALLEMAGESGAYWRMLEALHGSSAPLDRSGYLALAADCGLNPSAVEARLEDPADPAVQRVRRDEELADRLGIRSTPAILVLVTGQRPLAATARSLPDILNRLAP